MLIFMGLVDDQDKAGFMTLTCPIFEQDKYKIY